MVSATIELGVSLSWALWDTTRSEAWSNQPLPIDESVLVTLTPKGFTPIIRLPVWAIFLVIYPPLSLVFFWLTYAAFRWRWWRSGGLG